MSLDIDPDKQKIYSQLLYPKPKSSYNSDFFTRFDHQFIGLKKTYHSNDRVAAKIVKIFAKSVIIILLTTVKAILFVTVITPLVLAFVSVHQNRDITSANKDLKSKALAFVKASEAHMSFGNVKMAATELSNQSAIISVNDPTDPQALRNTIQSCQDIAALHYNLIVTAKAWREIILDKCTLLTNMNTAFKEEKGISNMEFIKYAVQDLLAQGCSFSKNINDTNAYLAMVDSLSVSTTINNDRDSEEDLADQIDIDGIENVGLI